MFDNGEFEHARAVDRPSAALDRSATDRQFAAYIRNPFEFDGDAIERGNAPTGGRTTSDVSICDD